MDKIVVSKILNHAEGGVTKVYDRWSADPEKIAGLSVGPASSARSSATSRRAAT